MLQSLLIYNDLDSRSTWLSTHCGLIRLRLVQCLASADMSVFNHCAVWLIRGRQNTLHFLNVS